MATKRVAATVNCSGGTPSSELEVGPLRPRSVSGRLGRDDGHRTDESKTDLTATVYLRLRSCVLPLGRLYIEFLEKQSAPASSQRQRYKTSITFVPPDWISSTGLHCVLDLRRDTTTGFPLINLSFNPIHLNHNPELHRIIRTGDVPALQQLFGAGMARPNDHVPYGNTSRSLIWLFAISLCPGAGVDLIANKKPVRDAISISILPKSRHVSVSSGL